MYRYHHRRHSREITQVTVLRSEDHFYSANCLLLEKETMYKGKHLIDLEELLQGCSSIFGP